MKIIFTMMMLFMLGCSSDGGRNGDSNQYDRAGRPLREPKVMNNKRLDSETLYQSCIKEKPEVYCRNRLGH